MFGEEGLSVPRSQWGCVFKVVSWEEALMGL